MLPLIRCFVLTAVAAWTCIGLVGCVAFARHANELSNAAVVHAREKQDLSRIRQDTRDELADQREAARQQAAENEVMQARFAAERQALEREMCRANQEALQQRLKGQIRDTLQSKVAFNLVQGIEVGELEVDTEALKQLLADRDKPPLETAPLTGPCECCDKPCGCEPGVTRRHCPHCRHKKCEAEKDCGGREALAQLEQQPLKRPLRPTEVPFKLPVRVTMEMQQPEIEAARIGKQPITTQPLKGQPCGCHPSSCTHNASAQAALEGNAIPLPPVPDDEAPPAPPAPIVEPADVYLPQPTTANPGTKLGFLPMLTSQFAWRPPTDDAPTTRSH